MARRGIKAITSNCTLRTEKRRFDHFQFFILRRLALSLLQVSRPFLEYRLTTADSREETDQTQRDFPPTFDRFEPIHL